MLFVLAIAAASFISTVSNKSQIAVFANDHPNGQPISENVKYEAVCDGSKIRITYSLARGKLDRLSIAGYGYKTTSEGVKSIIDLANKEIGISYIERVCGAFGYSIIIIHSKQISRSGRADREIRALLTEQGLSLLSSPN